MTVQTFVVLAVLATDEDSAEYEVLLRAASGTHLRVTLEGGEPVVPGEAVRISDLYFNDEGGDWADEAVPERDYFSQGSKAGFQARGQIRKLHQGDAVVDCAGILFRVGNIGHDPRLIGEYVKFSGMQIYAERE
jgi:hypothetical protein